MQGLQQTQNIVDTSDVGAWVKGRNHQSDPYYVKRLTPRSQHEDDDEASPSDTNSAEGVTLDLINAI